MSTLLADNAYGTLAVGLATGDTALTFTSGHGARFPTVTAPDVLYCCILNTSNILEEVIITAHASGADTATITRAAGSTVAKVWNIGDRIEARLSKTALTAAISSYALPSGTRLLFQQTSAPTGWTKDTTAALNDTALRIVTGAVSSGGSIAFSTAMATPAVAGSTAGYTLQIADIPSHSHTIQGYGGSISTPPLLSTESGNVFHDVVSTDATGGGGAHSHGAAGLTSTINVKYNDVIIASKDA